MTSVLTASEPILVVQRCPLCELGSLDLSAPRALGDLIAVYGDPEVIVFTRPPQSGVFVAPAHHAENISGFEAAALGAFLASLRRVTVQVRSVLGGAGPAISVPPDVLAGSEGHACFWVEPTRRTKGRYPVDPMVEAERLAEGLQ